jgi:hypothetical protein
VNHARDLSDLVRILLDTSNMLTQRALEMLDRLNEQLPPEDEPDALTADVGEDTTDTTHMSALLTWDNSGSGNDVTIDWGPADTTDDQEPSTGSKTYQYRDAGQYVVTVTDLDDPLRTVGVPVTVPFVTGA